MRVAVVSFFNDPRQIFYIAEKPNFSLKCVNLLLNDHI